ncbi:MAG: histidinol-phosphate transaminase [Cephaloticoccus sp.]|nr:histidinol-phosphate transaminase [Cephaloticoccus sp.]MCF7760615.1 histidinol-phosphate transaminase [Cephaloticoccus sp.]
MDAEFPHSLALPHLAKLHAYTPGLQPTEAGWTKLNTNECAYAPSPRVAAALLGEIGEEGDSLRRYPNPSSNPLRAALAAHHQLQPANVCVGNGSDDILNLLMRCFCAPGPGTGFTFPSYSLYPVLVGIQDGAAAVIEFDRSMQLPLDKISNSSARIFFLTSPNAPTGVAFANSEIAQILSRFSGILVVDEAYAPFAKENAISLLANHPRLVVVRTFSKAYALAGIRVGYALGHPDLIGLLDRVRDSYNVNRLSQVAALAALEDQGYYSDLIQRICRTRDHYQNLWRESGWFTYQSEANFIFTEPCNARGESGPVVAKSAYEYLSRHRVLVRYFPSHALTASFLRISVGTDDEMTVLQNTLEAWLKHA